MTGHAVVDIRKTYGCTFIGMVISIMLFGITILQTWIYYWQYGNRDQKALKLFVAIIFILDTLHTVLCTYSVYWYLVLNFGNVEILGYNMWSMNFQIDVNALVDYMVRLYYARRVYLVSGSIVIPVIIVVFGTVCITLAFVFTVKAAALKYWSLYTSLIPVTCIALGLGVVADILIALSMCWFLYHQRTGFARTDSMITTLMAYSINSGLLTSVLATAVLISFATAPSLLIWQLFFWPMSKFYANSLLAMLNSRDYIRKRSATDKTESAFDMSSIRIEQRSEAYKSTSKPPTVSVSVRLSATMDFPQGKPNHDVEYTTVDISKSGAGIPSETHGRTSKSSVYGLGTTMAWTKEVH
ncbi:hypothetical protein BJY52DRAFT_1215664 [Lactarius psammicola]|nr:hypothetical protein BJY52DRAFT_1215664 [Lactarius psammicola]